MWFIIKLKVSEKQGFTFSLENTFLEKPQGGGERGGQTDSLSLFKVEEL